MTEPDTTDPDTTDPDTTDPDTTEPDPTEPDTTERGPTGPEQPGTTGQVLLVRRRRAPALGFWVVLAVVLSALGGMVVAWAVDVRTPTGMLYFGATAVMFVGAPLALLAAILDAVADRRRRRGTSHRP